MRSIAISGCDVYSQIAVAHVTLPKAVLSTVEIFAVWSLTETYKNPIKSLKTFSVSQLTEQ